MEHDSRVVLVTGVGRGIGAGLAAILAERGWRVAGHHFDAGAVPGEPWLKADLSQPGEAAALVQRVLDRCGRLDAVVHNAAVDLGPLALLETTRAQYELILGVNLTAAFELAQAAARHMIARGEGGRIVNISSIHSRITLAGRAVYAASKGGLEALIRALALELGPHGITVNGIAPGFIEVERSRAAIPNYDPAAVGRAIPIQRVGHPEDVAAALLFLLSGEAAFVTGQTLVTDGGSSIKLDFQV